MEAWEPAISFLEVKVEAEAMTNSDFKNLLMQALGQSLPPEELRRWFLPLNWVYRNEEAELKLEAPTYFHGQALLKHLWLLNELASGSGYVLKKITVECNGYPSYGYQKPPPALTFTLPPGRTLTPPQLVSQYHSFERFLEAPGNRLARMAVTHFLEPLSESPSLLLLAPGPWGKTHLLDALTLVLRGTNSSVYRGNGADSPLVEEEPWPEATIIIFDDVHLLDRNQPLQQKLRRAFDQTAIRPLKLVFTAPEFPTMLNESLHSRLGGGLVIKIEPPDYNLMYAIGLQRCRELSLELPAESLGGLIRESEADPRRLNGLLETIHYITNQTGLTVPEALGRLTLDRVPQARSAPVAMESILVTVAGAFGLKISDLTGQSRLKQVAWPRRVAMLLTREMTFLTTTEIGKAFGNRDHSTVIHALKKIKTELKDPAHIQIIETLKQAVLTAKL